MPRNHEWSGSFIFLSMRIGRSWVNKRVVEDEERKRKENEIRMKLESGSLSARDPLPPRPLFAVESGLKKKMKTLDAASSGGKEIPVSRNETCIFPPSIRGIDDSMVRWLGMDVIGVKIEQSDCSKIDERGSWERFFRMIFLKEWSCFFLRIANCNFEWIGKMELKWNGV